jgi:AcrR family transcriptional regulator
MATPASGAPPRGLRERKKERTRETIANVALELFSKNGFHETTVRQIAEQAEVAPRTVSGYFPAKEDLVFWRYADVFASLESRLTHREANETAAQALQAWLRQDISQRSSDGLRRTRQLRRLINSEPELRTYERGLQEEAERIVARAVAVDLDLAEDDLLPHMVGAATIAALDALTAIVLKAPSEKAAEAVSALVDDAMMFIGAGIQKLAHG